MIPQRNRNGPARCGNLRHEAAFTWVEVLVCLFVLGVLVTYLMLPGLIIPGTLTRGQMTQSLSNMKQLHLATQSLVQDGEESGDESIRGWPGDMGGSYYLWARQLVPDYLSTNDFCKLLSAPKKIVPPGQIPYAMQDGSVLVYAVSRQSPSNSVFLSTANFTNGPQGGVPLREDAKPYGNKGFVVFRKGGDGAILQPRQVANTKLIGTYEPLCR